MDGTKVAVGKPFVKEQSGRYFLGWAVYYCSIIYAEARATHDEHTFMMNYFNACYLD